MILIHFKYLLYSMYFPNP